MPFGIPLDEFLRILLAVIAVLAAVVGSLVFDYFSVKRRVEETTEHRISKLTKALTDASRAISEMESEIKTRSSVVEKLRADAEFYERLAGLKKDELEAVGQVLRGELRREGRHALWRSALVNGLFFTSGLLVQAYVL